jgi:Flp pilus assembly protein TadG
MSARAHSRARRALARALIRVAPRVGRFAGDARGVAAVEFAYIVPVIILMLIGTFEISRAVAMDRRFTHVTNTIADLVAREEAMTSADLTAIYKIVGQIMGSYDSSSLKVSVIPVKASPSDSANTRVYAGTSNRPSYNGGTVPAKCSSYTLTSGLVPKGGSVIVVETSYAFKPIFLGYVLSNSTWTAKAIASPRNSCVDFDSDNCLSSCF